MLKQLWVEAIQIFSEGKARRAHTILAEFVIEATRIQKSEYRKQPFIS